MRSSFAWGMILAADLRRRCFAHSMQLATNCMTENRPEQFFRKQGITFLVRMRYSMASRSAWHRSRGAPEL